MLCFEFTKGDVCFGLVLSPGINDLHFNWNENTTLAQAEADLAEKKPASAPKFILFPQRFINPVRRFLVFVFAGF